MRHSPDLRSPLAALLLVSSTALAASFNLLRDYSGSNFFDGWDFKDGFDNTTNGDVNYLSQANASADHIAFIQNNQAIIKIDNTSDVAPNFKRNSLFLTTHEFYQVGSIFIWDAAHIPAGCSVWPSFWTRGPDWPTGGEIDVLENVNLATNNQMTLHTSPGCTQAQGVQQLGKTSNTDCSLGVNSSDGCTVVEQQPNSFGDAFNNAGGGVWATQFDESGIFTWFWTRSAVPQSISSASNSVDPSTFGTPSASWPSSSCNISEFFTAQQLVIDITLCGDFAGQPNVYSQTCAKPGENVTANTCYADNVPGNGSNYADAYFAINYVKIFSTAQPLDPIVSGTQTLLTSATVTPGGASQTGSGASPSGTTPTGNKGGGSGALGSAKVGAAVVLGAAGAAFAWAML